MKSPAGANALDAAMTAEPPMPPTPAVRVAANPIRHAPRFGISAKLQVAFGAVAGLTVLGRGRGLSLLRNRRERGYRT